MSPVLTRPRPATSPVALGQMAVVALGAILLVVLGVRLVGDRPSFVSELTVVNPTVYKLNVDLEGDGRGRLGLGTVRREQSWTFEQVIDQGATWVFRFSYGGVPGGELTMTRARLEAEGWQITVPADVGERLRLVGLRPSAP